MEYERLIEKYIQNKLSSKEKVIFDNLLNNDAVFREEVTLRENLKKVARAEDDETFKMLISNIEQQSDGIITKKRSYTKWLAAASIVLILGLSYFLTTGHKASSNELFASYFKPYRNVVAPIVRSNEFQDKKTVAFMAYEKGEYKTAITLFTNLYATTKEPYYLFYKANALLKLERAKEAIPLLLEHLKTKDTLAEKSNWYLALAYLKIKNTKKAKETLQKVITNKSYKNKEAQKLMNEFE